MKPFKKNETILLTRCTDLKISKVHIKFGLVEYSKTEYTEFKLVNPYQVKKLNELYEKANGKVASFYNWSNGRFFNAMPEYSDTTIQ